MNQIFTCVFTTRASFACAMLGLSVAIGLSTGNASAAVASVGMASVAVDSAGVGSAVASTGVASMVVGSAAVASMAIASIMGVFVTTILNINTLVIISPTPSFIPIQATAIMATHRPITPTRITTTCRITTTIAYPIH